MVGDVWQSCTDRGDAQRVFKVRKQALGLGWLVSGDLRANTVAFLRRLLACKADLLLQQDAERRAREAERPVRRLGLPARQHSLYPLAGRVLRAHNGWLFRLPVKTQVEGG